MWKKFLGVGVGLGFLRPIVALAHVKWFATPVEEIPAYKLTDMPVLVWIVAALGIILLGVYLDKKFVVPEWFDKRAKNLAPIVLSLASIGFGLAFIIFSYQGFVFAPNLLVHGQMGHVLLILQAVAGGMILLGFYERIGGALILLLLGTGIYEFGALEMADTLEMLGFAIYLSIVGRPRWHLADLKFIKKYVERFYEYAVPILRVGTGLNLVVLGFSEKILDPSLTHSFLVDYHWNFMELLGFDWFTDYWFAFSAGVVEVLFGVFLILGLLTRATIVALAVLLVTTLIILGPVELVGHLPHFSIAIVLLVLGAGTKLKLSK